MGLPAPGTGLATIVRVDERRAGYCEINPIHPNDTFYHFLTGMGETTPRCSGMPSPSNPLGIGPDCAEP